MFPIQTNENKHQRRSRSIKTMNSNR